jgi:nucleoside 2-deoxyribosyltransferase
MLTIFPLKNLHRVYCAGPLFNNAERREMLRIAEVLERADFEPFLPHHHGMEFAQVQPYLVRQGHDPARAGRWVHEAVFALDAYQVVVGCGSLVMNMNGRVPDEGATAEVAMAWTLGKPLVLYKEDIRSAVTGRDNPMIVGLADFKVVRELDLLAAALRERIDDADLDPDWEIPCPPHLESTLRAGAHLWNELCALGDDRPVAQVAEAVLELFGPRAEPAGV